MMNVDTFPHKRYRIVFTHEYINGEGQPRRLEDPIVVQYSILEGYNGALMINDMMNKLKYALLDRYENGEQTTVIPAEEEP